MIGIGIIGIGFMGMTHFEAARRLSGGRVVAIATRDARKLAGDWSSIQGNFGPRGSAETDLTGVARYGDYHDLLKDNHVQLVDICLPTNQHENVVLEALAAGKQVLVEKPLAIDAATARRLVDAADKANKLLMVGQVLPYFPEFRYVVDVVRSGQYGKLRAASFRRIIAPPDWSHDMADFRKLGGWGIDLHIHDNHFIRLLCGAPKAVYSRGLLMEGLVNHLCTQYLFEDRGLTVSCVSGGIAAAGLKFAHGYSLLLEQATIEFDAGTYGADWVVNRPLSVMTAQGTVEHPELQGGGEWCSAFTDELQAACHAVTSGRPSDILSGSLALDALRVCEAEAESIRRGAEVSLA